jgi:hypothetical protein
MESVKLGCCYRLTWRELGVGGEVFAAVMVKNEGKHVKDGEDEVLHGDGSAHSAQNAATLTDECKAFVKKQLLIGLSNEVIVQRAFRTCAALWYHWPQAATMCAMCAAMHHAAISVSITGVTRCKISTLSF